MTTIAGASAMTEKQFEALRAVILERSGVQLPVAMCCDVSTRLMERMEELRLSDFEEYLRFLTTGPFRNCEFEELLQVLAPRQNQFFANAPLLDALAQVTLPELMSARSRIKRLRLWSAACGSGEEPFTLAMIVKQALGERASAWQIDILGTDLSEEALRTAEDGVYESSSLRETPTEFLNRHFQKRGARFELDFDIRSMVSFEYLRLTDRHSARRHGAWDVIFLQSALHALDRDALRGAARLFHEQLAGDGWLFTGDIELEFDPEAPFVAAQTPVGCCYRKTLNADFNDRAE